MDNSSILTIIFRCAFVSFLIGNKLFFQLALVLVRAAV